jgi:hypothetical protein
MTKQPPIKLPLELVAQWIGAYFNCEFKGEPSSLELRIAQEAASWGYRQAREDARRIEARDLSAFGLLPNDPS